MRKTARFTRRFSLSLSIIAALMPALALVFTACASGAGASNLQTVKKDEALVIPVGEISETAKFYPVTVDGTRMEVVAAKAPDGTIRTAFNTCQVCNGSPKAYFEQSGTALQCQNCGNKFPMDRVGIEAGGCNPVPIFDEDKTVTEESITVPYDILQANAYRFPSNWKK
ncbi:MAG: DUF2318 domain-containing protein [Oscillospiraceae bacterium]|jgi:uncharacterized membrane protein|nr:DUF2318 domain-containing protein [Oscillospiraceae bacterium]